MTNNKLIEIRVRIENEIKEKNYIGANYWLKLYNLALKEYKLVQKNKKEEKN